MIDLHMHLDGSLTPKTITALAKQQGCLLPTEDESELKKFLSAPPDCSDLTEYLKCFELPLALLQTQEALTFAAQELMKDLERQNMIYAEVRFAPQLHTQNGLTMKNAVEAVVNGLRSSKVESNLILCCMRGCNNKEENFKTVELASEYIGRGVAAIDLAGDEAKYKTRDFEYIFSFAKAHNIPFTIHAGEADGVSSIRSAIDFGAKRIGHGVRAYESKELMQEIAKKGITLEICYSSNLTTKAVNSAVAYPIKLFLQQGIKICINTDNLTVSDTSIQKEFSLLRRDFNISKEQQLEFLLNAADASFADDKTKARLKKLCTEL